MIFATLTAIVIACSAITLYVSCSYAEHKGYMRGLDEAEEIMNEVQAVCKHGKWIYHGTICECSVCGKTIRIPTNYCGFCGSDMRGVE